MACGREVGAWFADPVHIHIIHRYSKGLDGLDGENTELGGQYENRRPAGSDAVKKSGIVRENVQREVIVRVSM